MCGREGSDRDRSNVQGSDPVLSYGATSYR